MLSENSLPLELEEYAEGNNVSNVRKRENYRRLGESKEICLGTLKQNYYITPREILHLIHAILSKHKGEVKSPNLPLSTLIIPNSPSKTI